MSYFPTRLFFKLPFFTVLYYLLSLCRPLFSQDEVDIINPGINPSSLPRPDFLPCKLNLEDTPEWHDKPQMKEVERQVITPGILQFISGTGGYLPGITGSPDMNDFFAEWFKKLSQKSDKKPGQQFNQTEANLDFKQPALLAFDPADERLQVVLTIDEHGHLNASELADDKEKISANLEWEDLGAIWRNNKNKLHTTSTEYTAEDFGDDSRVLAYLDTIGTNNLYYRTQADGTRVYIYRALDGKIYEVTAEDIKRSQRITYEYEMAKVSGEGLAAGGRVDHEGELAPIRPAEPDRSEVNKGILDQEIEAKQAPKSPTENRQCRNHPYSNTRTAKPDSARNAASVQKQGKCGARRTLRSSSAPPPAPQQSRQRIIEVQTDSTTLNHGYEDKGTFSIEGEPAGLKVAPDGSFFAGIVRNKVVIYVPGQGESEKGETYRKNIFASSLALSKDSLWMATTWTWTDNRVTFWQRGETVNHWKMSGGYGVGGKVKAMEFSPQGCYIAATLENDIVKVIDRRSGNYFELKPDEQFAFNEQEDFLITAEKRKGSGMTLNWLSVSKEKGDRKCHSVRFFDKESQNLYITPDAEMIVSLNENIQRVWRIEKNGFIARDHTSHCYRRVNLSTDHSSTDYGDVSDTFIDDNSAVIVRFSEACVRLLRTTRKGENEYAFVQTDFEWPVNNDVKITNAFYIPDGDRVAVIFSDGSMRMRQNVAEETGNQPLPDDSGFGEVLHYNGAKHCFLVRDSAGNIIVRQWSKQ